VLLCCSPLRLKQKNRQRAGGFVEAVLFVSAPPDRPGRGIKTAKEERCGQVHKFQFTKTRQTTPIRFKLAGFLP
jgi:hypothetical protein